MKPKTSGGWQWHTNTYEDDVEMLDAPPNLPPAIEEPCDKMIPHIPIPEEVRSGVRNDYQALDDSSYHQLVMTMARMYGKATAGVALPPVLDTTDPHLGAKPAKFDF